MTSSSCHLGVDDRRRFREDLGKEPLSIIRPIHGPRSKPDVCRLWVEDVASMTDGVHQADLSIENAPFLAMFSPWKTVLAPTLAMRSPTEPVLGE